MEEDKESELLSRVAANHLVLAQFEPFRAILRSLRGRNPIKARAILQSIITCGGKLDSVLWAPHSCPSPSLLTFLSTLELLQYEDPVSGIWSFNENSLKLRAEFLLYVQMICDKMLERVKRGIEVTGLDNKKMGSVNFDSPVEFLIENEEFFGSCGEYKEVMKVLGLIYSVGLSRLRPNSIVMEGKVEGEGSEVLHIQEEEMMCLKGIILETPETFDALCRNIELQIDFGEKDVSKINMENRVEEEVLKIMQSCVQTAHLDRIRECLGRSDLDGAISHLQFLHLDYGVEEVEYRAVLGGLLRTIFPGKIDYGSTWFAMREKLLWAYVEMLSSGCTRLVQMIQSIQDELLAAEIEKFKASQGDQTHIPLHHLQNFVADFNHETTSGDKESYLSIGTACCRIEMFHYARVGGLHILECVMNAALTAVKAEQFQEANSVLQLFPRLQPLVAVMGWDMLTGKTGLRRKLLQLLWTSKSQVLRMEESQLYHNKPDEVSSIEHLCDLLCYQLDLASFVACVNSGNSWSSKSSLSLSSKESLEFGNEVQWDPFVENYVLERLSIQSPLRVLFDVVPSIKFDDAVKLISMQPIDSALAAWKRMQDVELIHMRYALESAMYAVGSMERCATSSEKDREMTLWHLKDLKSHLDAIHSNPRKILMINIVISLVHMDDLSSNLTPHATPIRSSGSFDVSWWEGADVSISDGGIKMCAFFAGKLVDILKLNLPSSISDADHSSDFCASAGGKQPLEWRISKAKLFIDDWEWRLFILHILLPSTERQWKWREALSVLCAAPSKLLNLCMQKAKYDVGEQVVSRYSLSSEDKAALELAQWMDGAYMKATVEDPATYAGEQNAVQELDFSSLCTQLGPLAAILLCIDTISSSTKSKRLAMKLLNQAQMMLSEIHPGEPPKHGLTYWEQIHEMTMISVVNHVLRHLVELMQQDKYPPFQAVLSGEMILLPPKEFQGQGHGERAVGLLHQMIEDAHRGKLQFLSGKLHNLARAVADEDHARELMKVEGQQPDRNQIPNCIPEVVLGLGLRTLKQLSSVSTGEDEAHYSNDVKDAEKLLFGPMVSKPTTYLSQFILHIAAIGDIVDGSDTTHDFNYFSVIYEWPKDLITRLDFKQGSADIAGKVAEIRCADFVHEVIAACVPPVYPPRFAHSWACSPVVPAFNRSSPQIKLLSPSSREVAPGSYSHSSGTPGVPLYPLQLDMLKHLVELSPVRAVLACVFGSSILYHGCNPVVPNCLNDHALHEPDTDRLFYEFALDHSERFPALNNWIKMQTKFHVSELAGVSYLTDGTNMDKSKSASSKRYRDKDSDVALEVDDVVLGENVTATFLECKDQSLVASDPSHHSPKSESTVPDDIVFLSFDWESQAPYERAVERLIAEGKLMDALILSDQFLHDGASDQLLQLLIERGEQNIRTSDGTSGYSGCRTGSISWQYCIRMKDKHLAAELALRHLSEWNLDAALDVLTMCNCHLPDNDSLKYEVVETRKTLLRYNRILSADDRCSSWQEVEALCKDDPEGLALRLAEKGAVSPALEVAESAGLSSELRRELQGRRLVKLLTADPLSGGGPAAASRFLSSLQDTNDALPVAMGAMQLLPTLRSKQLLVHLLLKRKDRISAESEISLLNLWALGLKVLTLLPLPWQHRCSSLHGNPQLILEVLLMRKQLQYASQILKEFPLLRDNSLILSYAAKAIANSLSSPSRESKILTSGLRAKQKTKTGVPDQPPFSYSPSGSPKEGRRAFSWTPRHTGDKTTPRDTHRKRKGTGLTHSEKVSWEGMTGIREERISLNPIDGQERPSSASIAEDWMLTGDPKKDESVRSSHRYESAPDITLFKALLSLCSDDAVSGKGALDLCCTQMKNVLGSRQLPVNASVETIGLAYHATETFVQGLVFAKSQLRKVSGGSDLSSSNSEKGKDTDDAFSDAGSSSVGSQSTDELSDVIAHADIWLGRAELLQSLLGSGISASLDEIADKESSGRLRDRLIKDERYSMSVYTCKKCKIDVFPVWNAWGHALIRMERYAQARVKFKQAFQLYKGDPAPVVLEIINSIEGGPPVDFSSLRSMYDHLAKSAPTILDDSLSADSYLNVLHMPSTFPRSERSRRSHVAANDSTIPIMDLEEGSRRNMDTIRYLECVYYLQEYCRQHLLGFMFKHGHYKDACFLFFPPNSVPHPPQPSSVSTVTSSTSPQRPDPLAIDYGTIDDLCDLCITYGAMPVLEEVISTRVSVSQDPSVNQYNAAALARICRFCETHKHFNYLYDFQVVKKDYVSAGLCCIQLFMNSSSLEEAIRHLDHAKMHFDEGLSTRYKAGTNSTKLVTKGMRGKVGSEKLSQEGLVKFSARIAIQIDVVKCFNTEGPQWKYSLFGNPNDPETFKRRCEIAEALAEKSFDLAFQIIYEFNLPAVDIYAGVAASLAERKKGSQLTEFFRSIKGTIDDVDWDQVLGAAINVYANKHKERPDRLIDMLISSHRKVLACVVCGRLKSAFQIASKSGSVADVQYVAHQALHANALPVLDMCKQWLAQYM